MSCFSPRTRLRANELLPTDRPPKPPFSRVPVQTRAHVHLLLPAYRPTPPARPLAQGTLLRGRAIEVIYAAPSAAMSQESALQQVCACVRACARACVHLFVCAGGEVCAAAGVRVGACVCAWVRACARACVHLFVCAGGEVCAAAGVCVCVRACTYLYLLVVVSRGWSGCCDMVCL